MSGSTIDEPTVAGFGREWKRFDQKQGRDPTAERVFWDYFAIFPWSELGEKSVGLDMGCGTGRWARFVAPRVGKLICIDASEEALEVARANLAVHGNCEIRRGSFERTGIEPGSLDFAYCLGVVHHTPDPQAAIAALASLLRPGGILLLYI